MATGRPPWSEYSNPVTAMYHIACTDAVPEPPDGLSAEGKDFLTQCLRRDPSRRPDVTKLLLHPFVSTIPNASLRATSATLLHAFPQRPSTGHGRPATSLRSESAWAGALSPALGTRLPGGDGDAFSLEQWAPVPPVGRLEGNSPSRTGPEPLMPGTEAATSDGDDVSEREGPGLAGASMRADITSTEPKSPPDDLHASGGYHRSPASDFLRVHGSPAASEISDALRSAPSSPPDSANASTAADLRKGKKPTLFESLGFPLPGD